MVVDDEMQDEFGTMAAWTREAVTELGADHAMPAACRGSGRPSGLDWLLARLEPQSGGLLLDVGAGLGGPAAYARARAGVRPVCVDPMGQASAATSALFGLPALVGEGARLPFMDRAAGLVWSLGTLCTTDDKATWLAELRRILRPGGRLGLLVVTATGESFSVPWGNAFPSVHELTALLTAAGFTVLDEIWSDELADADAVWQGREDAVEAAVRAAHGHDDRYAAIKLQERRMGELLESGRIRGRLLVAATSG
ncbi:class I SAM-dependent methyltransferase [Intrasporangium sp.]|uniref:class I SAM-dependent methyltransferase n=1 Tax=Intrasporangium sp. TaxID=1925024 RepID=UPI0029395ABD|nr:methyltransferase domain-containing protein [Intrasporangium sp.]MDV3220846.1 methyltransferase domain-containing protein [Intrasporangium sp.]